MMNGYAFSYNELKGCFTLNDKFEITNLIFKLQYEIEQYPNLQFY